MSARLTYSLSDENQSLHKQMGCMNGIFQIFDRRYFLGGRSMAGRNRKKLLPPPAGQNDDIPMEQNSALQRTPGKNQKKSTKEKRRIISTESSRTSFSSTTSCSSSFSSLDINNRAAHLETPLFNHVDSSAGNTTREFPKNNQHNAATKQLSCPSFGFRDIVKDNINGEAYGISVRTAVGEEAVGRKFQHVDSPRPTRPVEYHDSRTSGSNESFRVLARFREAHRNANEESNISTHSAPKFNRRLSYDGRESYDTLKSTIKIRELPRLSLDSKESWARRSASGTRSNDLVKDLQKGNKDFDRTIDYQQEPVSSRQPSTVVAKLMGLEVLPDSTSTTNSPSRLIKVYPTHEPNSLLRSLRKNDDNTQSRFSGSPRMISHEDSCSPCLKNNPVMKPNACTKLTVETTQKSQLNRRRDSNEPAFESHELATDVANSFSVYGEIEKRLATLEFKKSGKDLRALKQILEAMQKSRAMLDKKEQASDSASQISTDGTLDQNRGPGASPRNSQLDNTAFARAKVSNSSKTYKSSIIIMKPARQVGKISNSTPSVPWNHDASGMHNTQDGHSTSKGNEQVKMQSTNDLGSQHTHHLRSLPSHSQPFTDKNTNTRLSKSTKSTKDQQWLRTEASTGSGNSPRITSSRLHKKFGLEKQSCPTTPPSSESSRTERINGRKVGPCSTEIKLRQKSPTSNQKSTKRSSKSSIGPGDVNQRGNALPLKPESNGAVASNINAKNTSKKQFDYTRSNQVLQDGCDQRNAETRLSNSSAIVKATIICNEQQSPVSVLDSTFYQDDSPSPVKKISYAFEDDETLNSEAESSQQVQVRSQKSTETLSTEINILKSEIDNLRRHIRQVNISKENEELLNDCKNHLCQGMNSQEKYISQILSESGLIKDLDHGLSAIQLHSPGHLINPNLFLALEQSKAVMWPFNGDPYSKWRAKSDARNKVQRKLVFDTVNEILLQKLAVERSSKHWFSISNIGSESSEQQILKELRTQIDQLQNSNQNASLNDYDDASRNMIWKDLMHPSNFWGDYQNNVAGLVLDVERLIFKDLVTEIVMDEAASLPGFSYNHSRKFPQQL